jgi:phosphatidylinositol alpha-1,6-mannosyltransferase
LGKGFRERQGREMNILIVALDFKPNTGGIAEYTHQIAQYLYMAGDDIMVLSKKMDNDEEFDATCQYKVARCNFTKLGSNRLHRFWSSYRTIANAAKTHSADIIISNCLESEAHICWFVSKVINVPYCVFTYGLDINTKVGLRGKIKRILGIRNADKVFCCSSFTKEIIKELGVQPRKIAILHPGISNSFLINSTKSSNRDIKKELGVKKKKIVLTFGRLVERKGIDKTLEAIVLVRQEIPDVVYVIAGDGPYRDTLEELMKKLHLQDNVVFTGYVSEDEKAFYYNAADVFVMPNRELENGDVEGFGIVFLEANIYGKPVIGGRSGGAVDAIVDGKTGLLVNPIDIEEIASAIIRFLSNEGYAKQLGFQGRKRVERDFNCEVIVSRMRIELEKL